VERLRQQSVSCTVPLLSPLPSPQQPRLRRGTLPGRSDFSAVTLLAQGKRWVVHNDAHETGRQASNIAHEIAHALLHHPIPALFDANGHRSHNKEHEEEANWLGPALLISEEAALSIVRRRLSVEDAAELYGTSKEVIQMRLNVNGAKRRVA
jgi:Zn-dependent peptidase ImmA (M78 family)